MLPSDPISSTTTRPDRPTYDEGTYLVEASLVLAAPVAKADQGDPIATQGATSPPLLVTAQPLRRKRLWIGFGVGSLGMVAVAVGITLAVLSKSRAASGTGPV
jgi:hypothetical protein